MTKEQRKLWEAEKRAASRLRDGLGRPVDRTILETVATLRMMGVHTVMSCGGHVDRALSPYVAIGSPEATTARRRASEAPHQAAKHRHLKAAARHNAAELATLLPYLDRFYRGRDVPQSRRLVMKGFGPLGHRLTVQAADLLLIAPRSERRALLDEQRQELRDFTEFLKAEVFGTAR